MAPETPTASKTLAQWLREYAQYSQTLLDPDVELIDRLHYAANLLEQPPEGLANFTLAIFNAIGEVTPKEAGDAWLREWPKFMAEEEQPVRISGDALCPVCQEPAIAHGRSSDLNFQGEPFLHRLCDGRLVKL